MSGYQVGDREPPQVAPRPLRTRSLAQQGVAAQIFRITSGHAVPLRIDWARLSERESQKLIQLTQQCDAEPGFSMAHLSKRELHRWEALCEKGADQPDYFTKHREDAALRFEFAQIAKTMSLPPRRQRFEEPGSVRLPASLFRSLKTTPNPAVKIETLGLYAFIVLQLENGEALTPNGAVEGLGDDATLVIDTRLGLGARFGDVTRWRKRLDHLATLKLLTVEKRGQVLRVGRGERTLKAARGPVAKLKARVAA